MFVFNLKKDNRFVIETQEENKTVDLTADSSVKEAEPTARRVSKEEEDDEYERCHLCFLNFLTETKPFKLPCGCDICVDCFMGHIDRHKKKDDATLPLRCPI